MGRRREWFLRWNADCRAEGEFFGARGLKGNCRHNARQMECWKDQISGRLKRPEGLGGVAAVQYNQSFRKAVPDFTQ
jgi:hypothetical protein